MSKPNFVAGAWETESGRYYRIAARVVRDHENRRHWWHRAILWTAESWCGEEVEVATLEGRGVAEKLKALAGRHYAASLEK